MFSVTLYRDGQIRIDGKAKQEAIPDVLRLVARALEDGQTVLSEYDEED